MQEVSGKENSLTSAGRNGQVCSSCPSEAREVDRQPKASAGPKLESMMIWKTSFLK